MRDEDTLMGIQQALDELYAMAADHAILVEGRKDRASLNRLGIDGEIIEIQGLGPLRAVERVEAGARRAVILTDWDRKGGIIASDLAGRLSALGIPFDASVRARLSALSKRHIKDVESLWSLVERLTLGQPGERLPRNKD
ncbi:MAG: Toprim subdomain protein [Candidatus Methanoplasma sp.]|jgi:dTMP kinase|nr:Toprim subdomain protein [Candidatus Methanoplasma sp.]